MRLLEEVIYLHHVKFPFFLLPYFCLRLRLSEFRNRSVRSLKLSEASLSLFPSRNPPHNVFGSLACPYSLYHFHCLAHGKTPL